MSTVENGNPAQFGTLAALDRRIDNIDREVKSDFANLSSRLDSSVASIRNEVAGRIDRLSSEQREQTQDLSNKIERSQRNTNPYQLILVMLAIGGAACAAGAYVAKNLSDNEISTADALSKSIVSVNETLGKTIAAVDEVLAKDIALNKKAIEGEEKERVESDRRIYEVMGKVGAAAWSRDAQTEFEKRIDEEKGLERDYVRERLTRDEHDIDRVASIVVPREDETQYRATVTRDMDRLDKTTADSLDRITHHLNDSDIRTDSKFAEQDKSLHGYGLNDEVKSHETAIRDLSDRQFQMFLGNSVPWLNSAKPKPPQTGE